MPHIHSACGKPITRVVSQEPPRTLTCEDGGPWRLGSGAADPTMLHADCGRYLTPDEASRILGDMVAEDAVASDPWEPRIILGKRGYGKATPRGDV